MKFQIAKTEIKSNLRDALRKCGYFGLQDRISNRTSYVKRLSKIQHYPRFHLYLEEDDCSYKFNLHLDQKQERYQGARAHSADYYEPAVNEESERIKLIIKR